MSEERAKSYGRVGWGIGASVLLHLLVAAAFLIRLPLPVSEPPKEETVQVELVPPPEPPKEKPKEPEKPELNLTMPKPEEKPPELPKPEPPKPEPAKPPEPQKLEETKPPEPPKPEPPKPEPPKPEPPKPEAPKPEEQAEPEAPKPEGAQDAGREKAPPLDVLRPVVEFGDKDSGPRKALDGDSAQEGAPADAAKSEGETKTQDANAAKPEDGPEGAVPPETAEAADKPPGAPVPDGITVPEVSAAAANPQTDAAPKNPSDALTAALVTPTPRPDGKPNPQAKPEATSDLPQAKRLFSTRDTGDAVARTAMGNIPREIRASQLCSTELKEQLRHGSPAYSPELLPSYRLPSGTVMEVRRGAFRADAQWYDLSFRCELDDKVTKVVSFAFDVGPPVPESQWRRRGFPEF